MEAETRQLAVAARRFFEDIHSDFADGAEELTQLGHEVQAFLGVPVTGVDPISEEFPQHQVVDVDLALERLLQIYGGRQLGVAGANRAHVQSMTDLLTHQHSPFKLGPISYSRLASGPDSERRVVTYGLGMLRVDETLRGSGSSSLPAGAVVFLQRGRMPEYGREQYALEVLASDGTVAEAFLALVRETMREVSVIRGQVISFQHDNFDYRGAGGLLTFLARPELSAEQVILPEGVLDRVSRHVIGIGQQRDRLRAAGQHLKRGVLLYGPPGTGKTHLVRYLLSKTPGTTVVLLSGRTLGSLADAAKLARAAQPAIVVMEDCDLVAEERGGDSNAVLFETLEAMDGLDGDADVTFILTTNRPDLLERALVERPGRVDLAVEIGKPDLDARARLFSLYGAQLVQEGRVSADTITTAAERTEGVTASFAKEAVRRSILLAAREDRPPVDEDLLDALTEMLSDGELLTRTLLGGAPTIGAMPWRDRPDPEGGFGEGAFGEQDEPFEDDDG
jgi:hypothetical protein